VSTNTRRA